MVAFRYFVGWRDRLVGVRELLLKRPEGLVDRCTEYSAGTLCTCHPDLNLAGYTNSARHLQTALLHPTVTTSHCESLVYSMPTHQHHR